MRSVSTTEATPFALISLWLTLSLWIFPLGCQSAPKTVSDSASPAPAATVESGGASVSLSSGSTADGTLVMVSVRVPAGAPASGKDLVISGDYEGTAIPFYPVPERGEGIYEAVVGVPVDHKPGPSEIKVSIGPTQTLSVPLTIISGQYPSTALTVAPGQVNPGKKALRRIKREIAETAPLYKRLTLKKYWNGPFVLPINSTINSPFGEHRTYNGEPRNYHPGLDLKAAVGTPIHAPAGGIVVLAKNLYFTGYTVMIDHGYGIITLYAHMSKLKVKKGHVVHAGDLLGLSGKTGRVTGPHLHWQVKIHDVKVNPLGLVQVLR